ncbi:MAG: diphthine--ammonia ligase [Candidatus Thermoplasmatota archaeon]|jgi:uncharacterized protein (TIGR00290 family)|nr:diphthine--ammonia ligase [Candidatus Thermoplasmatota archaeon]MCL5963366.1 diphthine--ammonia ligase [Candidatus Thermoplasmatota archaeon]
MKVVEVVVSWSGGKDSALALYNIKQSSEYKVISLLTTVTFEFHRVTMHGVEISLLNKQVESIGIPLNIVYIPQKCSMKMYENIMAKEMDLYRQDGIEYVVFGDIFLEDVRNYRDKNLKNINMNGIYPLWHKNSHDLALAFIKSGFKAIVVTVDSKKLNKSYAGKEYDEDFIKNLPENVDPCGENGEFHTFVYDGPIFEHPVIFIKKNTLFRDGFYYTNITCTNLV